MNNKYSVACITLVRDKYKINTDRKGLPKHHKSPQNTANQTAIHRKSGSSDFNDATTDPKSV